VNEASTVRAQFDRVQRIALSSGAIGLVLSSAFAIRNSAQFFRSYLFAYVFWLAIPMGCMAILMLHHLTGGWWGYPIRRLLEAGTRTFVWMAVLFVPVLVGMSHLYKWAQPAEVAADPMLQYKRPYLNPQFFTVRVVIYFAIWIGLAWLLNKWSREQDRTGDPRLATRLATRLEALSGPGLILWGIAVTYSSIDWVMSLEAHWFSTMYGMIVMVVAALTAMSFVVFVLRKLSGQEPIAHAVTASQFNDLGNLMLAFVMLWAYLSFSQFLIIWAGNIKDEIPWYTARAFGGWGVIAVILIVLHFALPFLLLLQRGVKRRLQTLSLVAGMLIVLSLVDVYWLVAPAYETSGPSPSLMDVFAVVGIGGVWLAAFISELKKRPLLPQHDPRFEGVLEHEHGG
jgi:hypothetical protein